MGQSKELLSVIKKLEIRLEQLENSIDPLECKAEGMLEIALEGVKSAANLLGEDEPDIAPAPGPTDIK